MSSIHIFFFNKTPLSLWCSSKHPRGLLTTYPNSLWGNTPVTEISCLIASVQAGPLGFNQDIVCSESWENRFIAREPSSMSVIPLRFTELEAMRPKLVSHLIQIPDTPYIPLLNPMVSEGIVFVPTQWRHFICRSSASLLYPSLSSCPGSICALSDFPVLSLNHGCQNYTLSFSISLTSARGRNKTTSLLLPLSSCAYSRGSC